MNHTFHTESTARAEGGVDSPLYKAVAEGGLAVCQTCHCYEGSLATECPGAPVHFDIQEAIHARKLDFVDGNWRSLEPKAELSTCTDCGASVLTIIGCPDGAEICQACFNAGHH